MNLQSSRRELMKLMGLAPAAVVTAKSELTALLASPTAKLALAATALGDGVALQSTAHPMPPMTAFQKAVGFDFARKMERLLNQARDDHFQRQNIGRVGGLDADIHVLRSASHSFKHLKQAERDRESNSFFRRAEELLWG